MNRLKSFFTTRGFYIALTLGVVAFAVLMGVYEYRENSEKLLSENSVDLNKSYAEGTPATETTEQLDVTSNSNAAQGVAGNTDAETESVKDGGSVTSTDKSNIVSAEGTDKSDNTSNKDADNNNAASSGTSEVTSDGTANIINEDGSEWTGYNGDSELVWPLIGSAGVYAGENNEESTGSVVIPYSMDTTVYYETLGVYKCNPGVMLRAGEGENVYSVYGGTVASIEETKEFGTVITIDMGNGYEAKYGQLMNVTVTEGEVIASGENIAEIGPVSSYYTKEGSHLYLAITKDGTPLNPMVMIE